MRVILLTGDRQTAQSYSDAAEQTGILRLCVMKNMAQVLERLFRDPFDALLSDDPCVLHTQIRKCPVHWPVHTFLLIDRPSEELRMPQALTFCFSKDSDPKDVLLRIARFPKGRTLCRDTETTISRFLQQTGVPVSLYGFMYLQISLRILLSLDNMLAVHSIRDIYALLSMLTGVSTYELEHAVRHAIDAAWMRADTAMLDKLFGYTVRSDRGAPSNAAFLFRAADHIRMTGGTSYDTGGNA